MTKSDYKSAISHIKPSEQFEEETIKLLEKEHIKQHAAIDKGKLNRTHTNRSKRGNLAVWSTSIAMCAIVVFGLFTYYNSDLNQFPNTSPTTQTAEHSKPPISAIKRVANIDGIIEEVSSDGKSFRIGSLWVTVTDATQYGIDHTNDPSNQESVNTILKVGNTVSGYTQDDVASGKVIAEIIYTNF